MVDSLIGHSLVQHFMTVTMLWPWTSAFIHQQPVGNMHQTTSCPIHGINHAVRVRWLWRHTIRARQAAVLREELEDCERRLTQAREKHKRDAHRLVEDLDKVKRR